MITRLGRVGTVLALVAALASCSSSGHRAEDSSEESSTTGTIPASAPASTIAGFGGGNSTAATSAPTTSSSTAGSATGGPTILSFEVTGQPLCPVAPTAAAPKGRAGRPITLAWQAAGAARVVLTVDDPAHTARGETYNPKSGVTLPFACDPSIQPVNSHLYTLTAGTVSKTITVSAKT